MVYGRRCKLVPISQCLSLSKGGFGLEVFGDFGLLALLIEARRLGDFEQVGGDFLLRVPEVRDDLFDVSGDALPQVLGVVLHLLGVLIVPILPRHDLEGAVIHRFGGLRHAPADGN